jgi:proline dehydrogenase
VRRIFLWAARNAWLRTHLSRWWFVRRAVRTFMPGETLADALAAAERDAPSGVGCVFTLLGENLAAIDEAEHVADHYREVLDEIAARGLRGEISVKLTQLGLDIDPEAAFGFVDRLAGQAAAAGTWLWIDMEASAYVEKTIALYERAARAHRNVGLCLQAYLHRTPADIARLRPLVPGVRMVKGAYDEPAEIAFRVREAVDAAYAAVSVQLFEALAAGQASRVILATHDTGLIEQLARSAASLGIERGKVEIQMLYGIRPREQRRLAAEGFDVRCLIAYGSYWFPWYMRRLAERPANVIFALRQLLPTGR